MKELETSVFVILYGPSAAWKSTTSEKVIKLSNGIMDNSISLTTRPQREEEINGVHYIFAKEDEVTPDDLLEHVRFPSETGYIYGTPIAPIDAIIDTGKGMLFQLDPIGTVEAEKKLKELYGDDCEVLLIHMNIPKEIRFQSLINQGYSHEEAEKRLSRDLIPGTDINLIEQQIIEFGLDKRADVTITEKTENIIEKILAEIEAKSNHKKNIATKIDTSTVPVKTFKR